MIETLLTSCQGSPEFKDLTFTKLEKKWVTLICCLNKKKLHIPPRDIRKLIFMRCLPKPKDLIDHIPLQILTPLCTMVNQSYKDALIKALTERHMNQLRHVLTSKVLIKKANRTPMQMAQVRGHEDAALLLNPKTIPSVKKIMLEKYEKLLNQKN